jgi:hypothetical protein
MLQRHFSRRALAVCFGLSALVLLPGAPLAATSRSGWVEVSPKDGGFAIHMPGTPKLYSKKPGRFAVSKGATTWIVEHEPMDPAVRELIQGGNRKRMEKILEILRDGTVNGIKGTLIGSNEDDFEGSPSVFFAFSGVVEGTTIDATQRIVLTADRMYSVVAMGASGATKKEDLERFFNSFRLTTAAPDAPASAAPAGKFQTISYVDAVCRRMPSVPVTFSMPADYLSRSVGKTVEGGCLWGTREDLDRVTASPEEGDFSALNRGVFRARVSTNVVCTRTGTFDSMDGTGEAGIRQQFEATGASLVTWKKETLAGLPALQIVADLPGAGRVYMLYLGNTRFSSNTLLVNYYQPKKRTTSDDTLWAHFVAGIRKAEKP